MASPTAGLASSGAKPNLLLGCEFEAFLRVCVFVKYRSVDENNNGKNFIRTGERAKIFLRIDNPEPNIGY